MPAILAGGTEGTGPVVRRFFYTHAALAAAHGQLGESAAVADVTISSVETVRFELGRDEADEGNTTPPVCVEPHRCIVVSM